MKSARPDIGDALVAHRRSLARLNHENVTIKTFLMGNLTYHNMWPGPNVTKLFMSVIYDFL